MTMKANAALLSTVSHIPLREALSSSPLRTATTRRRNATTATSSPPANDATCVTMQRIMPGPLVARGITERANKDWTLE